MPTKYSLNDNIKNLTPYEPVHGDFDIRLDANESFFSLDNATKLKITTAINELDFNRYPDSSASKLISAFSDVYSLNPQNVTAGNGSDELISLIVGTFLSGDQKLLSFSHDFSMYKFYASTFGFDNVIYDKNEDLTVDIDKVITLANSDNIGAIIFSNPCNPTSLLMSKEDIIKLITNVNCLVVLDEAYMDFCDTNGSLLDSVCDYDNLIILKTSSKAVGLASIRLGFAVANTTITNALKSVKSPYNVNSISQAVGCIIFSDKDSITKKTAQIIRNTKSLFTDLSSIFTADGDIWGHRLWRWTG